MTQQLADTLAAILRSNRRVLNAVRAERGLPPVPDPNYAAAVGQPIDSRQAGSPAQTATTSRPQNQPRRTRRPAAAEAS